MAIDPLPFVNPVMKNPSAITKHLQDFKGDLRISSDFRISEGGKTKLSKNNTLVTGVAISSTSVRVFKNRSRHQRMDACFLIESFIYLVQDNSRITCPYKPSGFVHHLD